MELDFAIRTGMLRERMAARSASPKGRSLKRRPGEGAMPERFVIRALTLPLRGVPLPEGEGLSESQKSWQESARKQETTE
jgi:hypothetical protein